MPSSEDNSPSSLFSKITEVLDSNVRLTRNVLYGIGLVGFLVAVKNSGLTHIIASSSDIPASFITRKVRVRCFVEAIGTRGIVHVQHRPFLNIIPTKWRPKSHVQLELALVDLSPLGGKWLQDTIDQKIIWFQPLLITESIVQAHIFHRKYIRLHSINAILIGQGICKVKDLTPEQLSSLSAPEDELLRMLLQHQMIASQKERGMWKIKDEPTKWTPISTIKHIISSTVHLWRKIKRKFSKK
uniref:Uncharacterized protein n=2 Tax=Magallana gigas TaxID=29159 RepID=A0A8W8JUW9_MAGGI|nr:protein C3orf33 homolog [Crassostrea gigas]